MEPGNKVGRGNKVWPWNKVGPRNKVGPGKKGGPGNKVGPESKVGLENKVGPVNKAGLNSSPNYGQIRFKRTLTYMYIYIYTADSNSFFSLLPCMQGRKVQMRWAPLPSRLSRCYQVCLNMRKAEIGLVRAAGTYSSSATPLAGCHACLLGRLFVCLLAVLLCFTSLCFGVLFFAGLLAIFLSSLQV